MSITVVDYGARFCFWLILELTLHTIFHYELTFNRSSVEYRVERSDIHSASMLALGCLRPDEFLFVKNIRVRFPSTSLKAERSDCLYELRK